MGWIGKQLLQKPNNDIQTGVLKGIIRRRIRCSNKTRGKLDVLNWFKYGDTFSKRVVKYL